MAMQSEELALPPIGAQDPSQSLVFRLDIFILAVIVIFSLFNVPRVLVYIMNNGHQIFQGFLLHSTAQSRIRPLGSTLESDEKKSPESPFPILESATVLKKRWHFPMHYSLRHPAASCMRYRIFDDYTIVQVVLMAGYTAAVFYTAFYGSNPFTNPGRIGWVIASQLPFVYAFATKNNVIGLLVGTGYEKLNYLHRHVGRLIVIGANVHAIGFIYKWSLTGNISHNITIPFIRWGIVALVSLDLLGFFSIRWVRMRSYNLFIGTHAVGLITVFFAVCLHQEVCIPFVIAGAVVYGLDHVLRIVKTRYATATLQTIPELGLTRIDIPLLCGGWRPGQHVRLRILSTAMGLWGMTEVHPFTIASATDTEQGLVLMCKKTGNWTTKLYKVAQATTSGEQGQQPAKKVKVLVEGPYGGIGNTTVQNYSGALFIVGGSGVAFALPAIQDLVLAHDRSQTKVIDVVWSLADPAALQTFVPLFTNLVSRGSSARLRISVFYTRIPTCSLDKLVLPPGITLTPGRPKVEKLLSELVARMIGEGGAHGAFVAVCGPSTLAKAVAHAVGDFDVSSKEAIGGIHFHDEVFGL